MKKLTYLMMSCAILFTASCSKDKEPAPPNQSTIPPRDYQVELRVSSTTDPISDAIAYSNETGNFTTISTPTTLPQTYKYKRNMKVADGISMSASLPAGTATSEITLTILLDGKQVKQGTARGPQARAGIAYVIGQ